MSFPHQYVTLPFSKRTERKIFYVFLLCFLPSYFGGGAGERIHLIQLQSSHYFGIQAKNLAASLTQQHFTTGMHERAVVHQLRELSNMLVTLVRSIPNACVTPTAQSSSDIAFFSQQPDDSTDDGNDEEEPTVGLSRQMSAGTQLALQRKQDMLQTLLTMANLIMNDKSLSPFELHCSKVDEAS